MPALATGLAAAVGARAELRKMSTDRPDETESPFTVDAGHWQIELDFANYTQDRQEGGRVTEWGAVPFNLRRGITPDFELGVFVEPYRRVTVEPRGGPSASESGPGDVTWQLDASTQLDAGVNFGVSRAAPDLQLFTGLSVRF